jgi:hypothetical protein
MTYKTTYERAVEKAKAYRTKHELAQEIVRLEDEIKSLKSADKYFTQCGGWCGETNSFDSLDDVKEHVKEEMQERGHNSDEVEVFAARRVTFKVDISFENEE